jgi:hypothetical protein
MSMATQLQVELKVSKITDATQTPPTLDPTPVYDSITTITGDAACPIQIVIPAGKTEVYVEAGPADYPNWLKFFGITPTDPTKSFPVDATSKKALLCFYTADESNQTTSIPLLAPVAYFTQDAIAPLFNGLSELEKVVITNNSGCDFDITIYIVRDVTQKTNKPDCSKK